MKIKEAHDAYYFLNKVYQSMTDEQKRYGAAMEINKVRQAVEWYRDEIFQMKERKTLTSTKQDELDMVEITTNPIFTKQEVDNANLNTEQKSLIKNKIKGKSSMLTHLKIYY